KILTVAVVVLFAVAGAGHAAMGNIATTYGLLPQDLASAQALSIFTTLPSAAYYNPAGLAKDRRGMLTAGMVYADHSLEIEGMGGSNPLARDGDVDPAENVVAGLKVDASNLIYQDEHQSLIPICVGLIAGVEDYGNKMLAFDSQTSRDARYFEYGRQSLFVRSGVGARIWRGIDAGIGLSIELSNEASLKLYSDLAGNTEYESLQVDAEPELQGILGISVDLQKTLYPEGCGWLKGTQLAFTYRDASYAKTSVKANTVIPGTIPEPGLFLAVSTIDSYQPETFAGGISWENGSLQVGLTVELQQWSKLEEEFDSDTIKDQADWDFKDIIVPRLGLKYSFNDDWALISGVAFEESPMDNTTSLNVNYVDCDRLIAGLGLSARFQRPWLLAYLLAYPLQIDLGYQYHRLDEREFKLTHEQAPSYPQPYETVKAEGDVHVFAGAIILTF
ncbi:MAG: outer membrane protein transport protein, partial [Thermodesulfobacteriota bacterium]|nr:outer membrane protein transport protein [Thermodesulfobacteriota bacterium]